MESFYEEITDQALIDELIADNWQDEYDAGMIDKVFQSKKKHSDYGNIIFFKDEDGFFYCLIERSDIQTKSEEELKTFINNFCDGEGVTND